jgi:hypothetical protein
MKKPGGGEVVYSRRHISLDLSDIAPDANQVASVHQKPIGFVGERAPGLTSSMLDIGANKLD